MFTSRTDNWGRVRQSFADQFEPDGTSFIYRRSQKGEALRVSSDERARFVDDFNRNVRLAKWIIYIGMTVVLGGIVAFSVLRGSDLSQLAIFAGLGAVMIPYFAYYRWAWTAPARELSGRTPVAGERSPEEVQRLKFQRVSYSQLGIAAMAALAFPFIGSSQHEDIFFGWNRLWLVSGAALLLFVAVQAFRKWRIEQEDSYRYVGGIPPRLDRIQPPDEAGSQDKGRPIGRYVFLLAVLVALPLLLLTPVGKQFVRSPSFFPILMVGCGGWALFSVARGFANGRIEPFVRGFYKTYERAAEPKRFWASMAWNGVFGCFCLWLAFQMTEQRAGRTAVQDRCYNEGTTYSQRDVTVACNELLEEATVAIREHPKDASGYFNRGYAFEHNGDLDHAIADFSQVIRLTPGNAGAYYYRWAAYKDLGDDDQAAADFATLSRLDPKLAANIRSIR